ncbi:MAG: hypothetical protein Q9168_005989, partial [Polycauliona sp. 1 TL-2023]
MSNQKTASGDLADGEIKKLQKPSAEIVTPGKRPNAPASKTGTPTLASATRPTKSSASRGTPTAGPAKPSARPAVNTTRSRPQSTILSSASPSIAHEPRASVNSVTNSTKGYGGASVDSKRHPKNKPPLSDYRSRSTSPIKPRLNSTVKQATPRPSSMASKPVVVRHVKDAAVPDPTRNGRSLPQPSTPDPTKKMRPALGTRKSTMSVTIEQRLRDISLVHQMLRVAMANDGDDDDEVKEQYGKEADERLADLRARLEEARAAEGHVSPEEQPGGLETTKKDHENMLEAISQTVLPEDPGQLDMQLSTEESNEDRSGANAPKSVAEDLDQSGTQSSDEHEVKRLQVVNASLVSSLEHSRVSLRSKETELDQLSEVIATMQTQILEIQSEGEQEAHRCQELIDELRASMEIIDQAKKSAEHEVQQLGISKQQHVEQSQKNKEWLEQQLRQREDAEAEAALEHLQVVSGLRRELEESHFDQSRETSHLQGAVESLQKMIEELNDAKQRDIDTLQDALASDHENVVAKLRVEHEKAKSQLSEVRTTLGIVHAANAGLRQAKDNAEQENKGTTSELKNALAESKAQLAQSSAEKAAGVKQIQYLQDANGTNSTSLRSTEEDLKQASEKIVDLQKQREGFEQENQALSKNIQGLEQELARVSSQSQSNQQRASDYQAKLDQLQREEEAKEQAIEQLAERRLVVRSLQQTVDVLRQETHSKDTQLDILRTEYNATVKRTDATRSSNVHQLEKLAAQLRDAQKMTAKKTQRIREVESALKVTTAELVELQTERLSQPSDSDVASRRRSLRLSRWPKADSSNDSTSGESYDWTA